MHFPEGVLEGHTYKQQQQQHYHTASTQAMDASEDPSSTFDGRINHVLQQPLAAEAQTLADTSTSIILLTTSSTYSSSSAESRRTVTTETETSAEGEDTKMAVGKVPRYMQQFLAWLAAFASAEPYLSVPSSLPSSNVSGIVDPNFAGFAFEQASLWNYAVDADGNANQFSINLIAAITNRTGGIPLIRLGGTS